MNIIKFIKDMNEKSNELGTVYQVSFSALIGYSVWTVFYLVIHALSKYPKLLLGVLVLILVGTIVMVIVNNIKIIKAVLEDK